MPTKLLIQPFRPLPIRPPSRAIRIRAGTGRGTSIAKISPRNTVWLLRLRLRRSRRSRTSAMVKPVSPVAATEHVVDPLAVVARHQPDLRQEVEIQIRRRARAMAEVADRAADRRHHRPAHLIGVAALDVLQQQQADHQHDHACEQGVVQVLQRAGAPGRCRRACRPDATAIAEAMLAAAALQIAELGRDLALEQRGQPAFGLPHARLGEDCCHRSDPRVAPNAPAYRP